jgi:hypothetical protein
MIYTHVLKTLGFGVTSALDRNRPPISHLISAAVSG